jgi:hypothetical protein
LLPFRVIDESAGLVEVSLLRNGTGAYASHPTLGVIFDTQQDGGRRLSRDEDQLAIHQAILCKAELHMQVPTTRMIAEARAL